MAREVKRRPGVFEARRRLPDGSRPSFYGKSPEEAEAKAQRFLNSQQSRLPGLPPRRGTVAHWVEETYLHRITRSEYNTRRNAGWALDRHILPAIGHLYTKELKLHHCLRFFNSLSDQGYSPWTIKTIRKFMYPLCRLMAREGLIPYNYMEEVEAPSTAGIGQAVLMPWQTWTLWQEFKDDPIGAGIFAGAFLGLRTSERLYLSSASITAEGLAVKRQAQYREGGWVFPPAKSGSSRTVPLPPCHRRVLESYCDGALPLMRNVGGNRLMPGPLYDAWYAALEWCGFDDVTFNSLRHSFASGIEILGCPRVLKMEIMGHSKHAVADIYPQGHPEAKIEWLEKYLQHAKNTVPEAYGAEVLPPASTSNPQTSAGVQL